MTRQPDGPNHPVVVAPHESRFFVLPDGVRLVEPAGGSPGVTLPRGVSRPAAWSQG